MYADEYDLIRAIAREPVTLYTSLHFVGDDLIKSKIEDALTDFLGAEEYKIVCAVFDWATQGERKQLQQRIKRRLR